MYPSMYSGEKISDEIIERILENANWAPTHRMTEPWRFIIFKGDRLKDLSDYLGSYYLKNTLPEKISQQKLKRTKNKALKSSHVIAICMQRDPEERVPEWEEIAAVGCAVMNMWLSCSSLGLGCYWSSPSSALNANEFLSLPTGQKCLGWFYIGVPVEVMTLEGKRSAIQEKIKWM